MNIGVYGNSKKIIILYLLRLFEGLGDTCFISNNQDYEELSEFDESNITTIITESSPDEVFGEIGHRSSDFDYILYDIEYFLPNDIDLCYIVRNEEDELDEDMIECLPNNRLEIVFNKSSNIVNNLLKKKTRKVKKSIKDEHYVKICYEQKDILPAKNVELVNILSKDFAHEFTLKEECINHILTREGV